MFWNKSYSIKNLDIKLPFEEIRKRARIIVIDDDKSAFPYELLQKEGYNVTYWSKIEKLRELESGEFDLIVLDISGVADKSISLTDGAGILSHLKKCNPAQLIIAYSGQKYDLSKKDFYNLADDFLGKPSDLITCKDKIDSLLRNHFTPQHYWSEVEKILKATGISTNRLKELERQIISSLQKGQNVSLDDIKIYTGVSADAFTILGVLFQILGRFFGSN